MKLITENGELQIPGDFSFEVERNNPFLSDEGDATVPATIPASSHNLRVLNNIHRIDKSDRFMKKVPAILQHGVWRKHGQLVIDTINKRDGITVSFAIENSDIYSQYKEKSLKEIVSNKVRRDWASLDELIDHMNSVAFGFFYFSPNRPDYDVFPVAIAKYEDDKGTVVYQFNNEIRDLSRGAATMQSHELVSEARTVQEDGLLMGVPQGYGVSPFLYLGKAIDVVFEEMGYQIESNCFNQYPLDRIVLLNNLSDTIVKGELAYSDMMPSCTLSEFVEFLKNKFCVVVRADSSSKKIWVETMQEVIQNKIYDIDISKMVDGDLDIIPNESSRVVLSSDTSIEGSEPAAATLDELVEKYGFFVDLTESQFDNIGTPYQTVFDCIVRKKTTGEIYELKRSLKTGHNVAIRIGTDYFKYDRKNSDTIEEYSSQDLVPPSVRIDDHNYLYIGDRLHFHTSFNNKNESVDQKIMVCWSFKKNWGSWYEPRGFLSKYTSNSSGAVFPFSLNTYEMYGYFWSNYNNLLLNNKITVRGKVDYPKNQLAMLNMVVPKYYKGQLLLPESISYNLGKNKSVNDSQFILIKSFTNQIEDHPINPLTGPSLKWQLDESEVQAYIDQVWTNDPKYHYQDDSGNEIIVDPIPANPFDYTNARWLLHYYSYKVEKTDTDDVYLGPPSNVGQVGYTYQMKIKITISVEIYYRSVNWQLYGYGTADFNTMKPARFVAVPV